MASNDPSPGDPKLRIFSWVTKVCRKLIPANFRRAAGVVLFGVTPDIPISLVSTMAQKAARRAFVYGFFTTFLFCFVVIAVWTSVIGTFQGSELGRVYFRDDKANLIEYSLLCPLYVGLSATLVVLSCRSWVGLRLNSSICPGALRIPRLPLGLAFIVGIGLSSFVTCRFISECLDPNIYEKTFWYISYLNGEHQRMLGSLGIYYSLLNYSLFLVIFAAIVALLPIIATAAEVGRCLRAPMANIPASFGALRTRLSDFVSAYLVAKAMTFVLILNYITWGWLVQGHSVTKIAMGAALSLVCMFFVSFPRYYVELEWFMLDVRRAYAAGEPPPTESEDLRSPNVRMAAHFLAPLPKV